MFIIKNYLNEINTIKDIGTPVITFEIRTRSLKGCFLKGRQSGPERFVMIAAALMLVILKTCSKFRLINLNVGVLFDVY